MRCQWAQMNRREQGVLMTMAAMHRELGPEANFTGDAIAHILGEPCPATLGWLVSDGYVERRHTPDGWAYNLTPMGLAVLPVSEERRALEDHREAAAQALREEM